MSEVIKEANADQKKVMEDNWVHILQSDLDERLEKAKEEGKKEVWDKIYDVLVEINNDN